VQKRILLAAIQKEIQRHDLSYFVDEPPPVAQGGKALLSLAVQRAGKESIRFHSSWTTC
jgi:hypothetical protein